MIYGVGELVDGFKSEDGHAMRVGQRAYVKDDRGVVRTGILLYREGGGVFVMVDGHQWPDRIGIYATRRAADLA